VLHEIQNQRPVLLQQEVLWLPDLNTIIQRELIHQAIIILACQQDLLIITAGLIIRCSSVQPTVLLRPTGTLQQEALLHILDKQGQLLHQVTRVAILFLQEEARGPVQDTHPDLIIHLPADLPLHTAVDQAQEAATHPDRPDRQVHLPVHLPVPPQDHPGHQEVEDKCNVILSQ